MPQSRQASRLQPDRGGYPFELQQPIVAVESEEHALASDLDAGSARDAHSVQAPGYASVRDPEKLREIVSQIAARRPQDQYAPAENYVTLAMAGPRQALVTWRVLSDWEKAVSPSRADGYQSGRLVIRLYDVTFVEFDGFNARRIVDVPIEELAGERLVGIESAGTVQLAEAGYLRPTREFVPAARSRPVHFPSGAVAAEYDPSALFVDAELRPEPVPTPWEASHWIRRRSVPQLRSRLRVGLCAIESSAVGDRSPSAAFVGELGRELSRRGHEVHVVMPRKDVLLQSRAIDGVEYHPVDVGDTRDPLECSRAFGRVARSRFEALGRFDWQHAHEWMAGEALGTAGIRSILSLSSTETIRLGSPPHSDLSQRIQTAERSVARAAKCVLVPRHLHAHALGELGVSQGQLIPFSLEGRCLDEWEAPLELGQVKAEMGLGPFDRVYLFVGPIEWGAGPDLLVEALPALLARHSACRLVYVGLGGMQGHLQHRARVLGVEHAVRWLGHVEGPALVRVLRAAEALVLPSRRRESFDEGVVSLARRAGLPVITTHGGPSHLVAHDQNGLVTYDNPGSMVWALGELLGDLQRGRMFGAVGRRIADERPEWSRLVDSYTQLCAEIFPELAESAT